MRQLRRGLLCMAFLLLVAAPAHAADEIGLSPDGITWASALSQPLFDPDFRWVPGDSETATFYVRNQGPTSAFMTIEARSADTDLLLSNEDIALRARVGGGDWVDLDNGVPTSSLTAQSIGQGEAVRVDVNAIFDPASTNQSQYKELALAFTVTLFDSLEGGGDDDGDDGGTGGLLPGTGAEVSVWLLLAAGLMLMVGAALVRRRGEVRHV